MVWGGEFGRTPQSEKGDGRDHNPTGVHDIHSTILFLMGLDHKKLVYFHAGRPERVDANEGHVYEGIAS